VAEYADILSIVFLFVILADILLGSLISCEILFKNLLSTDLGSPMTTVCIQIVYQPGFNLPRKPLKINVCHSSPSWIGWSACCVSNSAFSKTFSL
jgi:hypothetical protein